MGRGGDGAYQDLVGLAIRCRFCLLGRTFSLILLCGIELLGMESWA